MATCEYIPISNQKFDIGRIINFSRCDCEECDYVHCPKNNYAVKMKRKSFTVKTFFENNKSEILALNKPARWQCSFRRNFELQLNYALIVELFDTLNFAFPKGTYWAVDDYKRLEKDTDKTIYRTISIVKFSRRGSEITLGTIEIANGTVSNVDFSQAQEKLASKISKVLTDLKDLIFSYYYCEDEDWVIGWLSPEGRHYPCNSTEHQELAITGLGSPEVELEIAGWVKVALSDTYFCNRKKPRKIMKLFALCATIILLLVNFSACTNHSDISSETQTEIETTEIQKKVELEEVTLLRIVDGDTVLVKKTSGESIKVRLIGIDTPESVNPDASKNTESGKIASDYLKKELPVQHTYYLEYDSEREDKYGRTLAYLWLTDDPADTDNKEYVSTYMLNAILLKNGYATTMTIEPNTKYAKMFDEIKNEAKSNNVELWTATDLDNWS